MSFFTITKKELIGKLKKIGLEQGDIIYVPSFTSILGNAPNVLDDTIDALIEVVGVDGTVVMPTFNWNYCKGEVFDPETTPSQVGVLTEVFRKRPGVRRNIIPPWCTFAAIGKSANDIVSIEGTSSFGDDSILQYLYDINAKYVMLGCTYNEGAVHIHWLEEKFEVPYRYMKQFKGKVRLNGKLVENVSCMYARDLDKNALIDSSHLTDIFDKRSLVKIEKLGYGELRVFRTKDYVEFMTPYFENDRLAVLLPEAAKHFVPQVEIEKKKGIDEFEIKGLMGKAWGIDYKKISSNVRFNEFPQWDSLGHVSLLIVLEEEYGVSINFEVLTELVSIHAIIEYLSETYCAG